MAIKLFHLRGRRQKGRGLYSSISQFGRKMRPIINHLGNALITANNIKDLGTTAIKDGGKLLTATMLDQAGKAINTKKNPSDTKIGGSA